jgi:hypothetical protein
MPKDVIYNDADWRVREWRPPLMDPARVRELEAALARKDALLRQARATLTNATAANRGLSTGAWADCKDAIAAIDAELKEQP